MDIIDQAKDEIEEENELKAIQIVKYRFRRIDELKQEVEEIEKQIAQLNKDLDRWRYMTAEHIIKEKETDTRKKMRADNINITIENDEIEKAMEAIKSIN
jgi:outer membrane murein-binding lipoprotein Lpp